MYNQTDGSHPNCSRVWAYGVCIPEATCDHFTLIPREHQCDFVNSTADCFDPDAYIQYMHVFACLMNDFDYEIYFGLAILVTELMLLFLVLSVCSENFFTPTLCSIANWLGLSENLAGVTLLSFGNASPDIFTSLAGATVLGPELVECQLLGGGIFVTSIVAAAILLTKSFYALPSAFIRDTVFYMCAIIWFRYISSKEYLYSYETVILIVMYFVYVGFVIVEAFVRKRLSRDVAPVIKLILEIEGNLSITIDLRGRRSRYSVMPLTDRPRRQSVINENVILPPPDVPRRRAVSRSLILSERVINAERLNVLKNAGMNEQVEEEREGNADIAGVFQDGEVLYEKKGGLFEDFINEVLPVDDEEWNSSGTLGRFLIIMKSPIVYFFKYIIPVVDQGALNNGWCKLLNCIHIVICPLLLCVSLRFYTFPLYVAIGVMGGVFITCLSISIFVYKTTRINEAPRFHMVFAIMGFLASMNMIYTVAHELVTLLSVTGFLLNISIATLAMTFLAYGNSVGDLVSNTALARAGYPRMAWAGCFGSPLLAALLGAGGSLTFLVETKGENHKLPIDRVYSGLITNCFFFLVLSLGSSLFIIPALNFQCRRSYASFLILIYAMFLSFSLMCEFEFIHPLGL